MVEVVSVEYSVFFTSEVVGSNFSGTEVVVSWFSDFNVVDSISGLLVVYFNSSAFDVVGSCFSGSEVVGM